MNNDINLDTSLITSCIVNLALRPTSLDTFFEGSLFHVVVLVVLFLQLDLAPLLFHQESQSAIA